MQNRMREYSVSEAVVFYAGGQVMPVQLCSASLEQDGARWASCRLIISADPATGAQLEQLNAFGNAPEQRLEKFEASFSDALPIMFELVLRTDLLPLIPPPAEDALHSDSAIIAILTQRQPLPQLLEESAWRVSQVWQEHRLDPSIGGGVMKIGYRTKWSTPRNEIDRLKRRGPVTKMVVEMLIENSLPVHFNAQTGAFELMLSAGDQSYISLLRPMDDAGVLNVEVELPVDMPADEEGRARCVAELAAINAEITVGAFQLQGDRVWHIHSFRLDGPFYDQSLVMEMIRAGVTLMRHNASRILGG